ncbi:MAG TPA: hypothetical protein VGH64_08675 [Puia sp.]|jgi:hypothetical protein
MKHLFFFACAATMLISISCKKDSPAPDNYPKPDSSSVSAVKFIYITDSNWNREGQRVFKSDLTAEINAAGASVNEVYSMQFVSEGSLFQFFPCCQQNFMGGHLSGAVYTTADKETCTLTFYYSDQDAHSGELPNPWVVPFQSIVIKVWLWQ